MAQVEVLESEHCAFDLTDLKVSNTGLQLGDVHLGCYHDDHSRLGCSELSHNSSYTTRSPQEDHYICTAIGAEPIVTAAGPTAASRGGPAAI